MKLNIRTLIGLLLIVGGVLSIVFGGLTVPTETHSLDLGIAELSVQEQERINIPLWAGVAAIVAGAVLAALSRRQ